MVEENRKLYVRRVKEKNEKELSRRRQQEERDERTAVQREIWEKEILPNWDAIKRTKRVRELWV